jgi:hypothetical protein
MSIFDKLKFWGSKDNLGLGDDLGLPKSGYPADELGAQPFQPPQGLPQRNEFQHPRMESLQPSYSSNKDMEVISAKLDALKATLDSINQRVAGLERVAYGEDTHQKRGW